MSRHFTLEFALLKYSFATHAASATSLNWTHVAGDTCLIVTGYGMPVDMSLKSLNMRIMQGAKALDVIDLADVIRKCDDVAEMARRAGQAVAAGETLAAVYRRSSATVALQYPRSNHLMQKMQFKFRSGQDLDQVLAILENAGFCMESRDAPPVALRPHSGQQSSRPVSSLSPHFGQHQKLSRQSAQDSQPHIWQAAQILDQRPTSSPYPQRLSGSHRSNMPLFSINEDASLHSDRVAQNAEGITSPNRRVDPLRRDYAQERLGTAPGQVEPFPSRVNPPAVKRSSTLMTSSCSTLEDDFLKTLPPRRELPFPRSDSSSGHVSRGRTGSRTSTADIPPLPKPSIIKPALVDTKTGSCYSKPSLAFSQSRSAGVVASKGPEVSEVDLRPASEIQGPCPQRPSLQTKKSVEGEQPTILRTKHEPIVPKEQTHSRRGESELSAYVTATSFRTHQAPEQTLHRSMSISAPPAPQADQYLSRIRSAFAAPATELPAAKAEKENLGDYVQLPYADRQELLEKMLVDAVEDSSFVGLCEDVGAMWQRIAFGRNFDGSKRT